MNNQGKSILVVDDDPCIRLFLSLVLELEGFVVVLASDGVEALRRGCQGQADAIVVDLLMPIMSGREFIRQWRSNPDCPDVPIVVMTASCEEPTADGLGVESLLAKPFDLDRLVWTLEALL